jgi:hypothetical protein
MELQGRLYSANGRDSDRYCKPGFMPRHINIDEENYYGRFETEKKLLIKLLFFKWSVHCYFFVFKKKKAQCIPTTLRFTYLGVSYTGAVITNPYYPTYDSMFAVYLGLQDKTSIVNLGTYSFPTVKVNVAEQRIVSLEKRKP